MWDEIAALAWMDPSIITRQEELYVQWDLDVSRFYSAFAALMSR
jgi:hypothetical protein